MIGMNIRTLRKKKNLTQEALAERLDVSRQTVAKWENDESLPDIQECRKMARILDVTLEQLSSDWTEEELLSLGPKGKHFFGVATVGERGQLVIPKKARELYHIQPGDQMIVLGEDETQGIALLDSSTFLEFSDLIRKAMSARKAPQEEDE